jgi:hypothetical protein
MDEPQESKEKNEDRAKLDELAHVIPGHQSFGHANPCPLFLSITDLCEMRERVHLVANTEVGPRGPVL